MEPVLIFDFMTLVLIMVSLLILALNRAESVSREGKLILVGFLFVSLFYIFSNLLEVFYDFVWMDVVADYAEVLQPVLFGFFLFSHIRSVEISRLRKTEKELRRSEERKDLLNTLLRQDLGSKYQTIQGYLQLIEEEIDLPEEHEEYLKKAIKAGGEVDEILELAKKLEEIEEVERIDEKDIINILNQVIDDNSNLFEEEGVEIEKNYPKSLGKVKGDYSLKIIFSQILITRIQTFNTDKVRIEAKEQEDDNILVRIKNNGDSLPKDLKNIFSGESYTGETTGVGGFRTYMIREIAEHNNVKIEVKDSELEGSRFNIYLQKA